MKIPVITSYILGRHYTLAKIQITEYQFFKIIQMFVGVNDFTPKYVDHLYKLYNTFQFYFEISAINKLEWLTIIVEGFIRWRMAYKIFNLGQKWDGVNFLIGTNSTNSVPSSASPNVKTP